jgi:hypothetical protein
MGNTSACSRRCVKGRLELTVDNPNDNLIPGIILPFITHQDETKTPPAIAVLSSAADILDAWCGAETVSAEPYLRSSSSESTVPLSTLLDFVECAQPRGDQVDEDDEEEAVEGEATTAAGEKAFAKVKGNVINALVGLSSSIAATEAIFWSRMRRWLSSGARDDLLCCALLSFGNRVREDTSARALLQGEESLLPWIWQILLPGITAQVLHSIIGLIRNLSIPEANKVVLGDTDILDKLVELGVWTEERDLLGSVQGGAVGSVKNLCRGNGELLSRDQRLTLTCSGEHCKVGRKLQGDRPDTWPVQTDRRSCHPFRSHPGVCQRHPVRHRRRSSREERAAQVRRSTDHIGPTRHV